MSQVLVTGGSGFIGAHAILQLLAQGHQVRATVRSVSRAEGVRAMLRQGGVDAPERVDFAVADLSADAGWGDAVAGCDYVLHVASPFPERVPTDAEALIGPARDGALRVLRAARDAGVKRVVLTSSFAAIGYGHGAAPATYDETHWTDLEGPGVMPYPRSKTMAERAAWDFIARSGGALELAVVNPVAVLGPVLGPDYSTSILLVSRMLEGRVPGCPKLCFGVVDVRDVADLHLRAMTVPAARGERFLAVAGDFIALTEVARVLRGELADDARRVPRRELPNWLVRVAALADPPLRQLLPELGVQRNATARKAERLLGWNPRPPREAIVATARSLLQLGLVQGS